MFRLAFIFFLLLPHLAFSQIKWLEEEHNFGAFDESVGKVSCEFKFIHETGEPIFIKQVHVTCGCTTSSFEKKAVEPGDTGKVIISYNSEGRPGRFEKKIYVDLNTIPSRYSLKIKGSVMGSDATLRSRYPFETGPLRLRTPSIPFGEVNKGNPKSYFLEVYNASTDTLAPQFSSLPDYITVGKPREEINPGDDIAYTFILSSAKINEYGFITDSIALIPDINSQPIDTFYIPIMVMINEDFSDLNPIQLRDAPIIAIEPEIVDFGTLSRDEGPVTKSLKISNRGKNPLVIHRIYSADSGISVKSQNKKIKRDHSSSVDITVDVRAIQGDLLNGRIMIISNDPNSANLPVRVVGLIK